MRYVAKIHVMDVMDSVVVSGYVVDCDVMSDPDHEACEFAYTLDGLGLSGHMEWLDDALRRALLLTDTPRQTAL
jgi:hypothetical protein